MSGHSETFLSRRSEAVSFAAGGIGIAALSLIDPTGSPFLSAALLLIGSSIAVGGSAYAVLNPGPIPGVISFRFGKRPRILIGARPTRFDDASLRQLAICAGTRLVDVHFANSVESAHDLGRQIMRALGEQGIVVNATYGRSGLVLGGMIEETTDTLRIHIA